MYRPMTSCRRKPTPSRDPRSDSQGRALEKRRAKRSRTTGQQPTTRRRRMSGQEGRPRVLCARRASHGHAHASDARKLQAQWRPTGARGRERASKRVSLPRLRGAQRSGASTGKGESVERSETAGAGSEATARGGIPSREKARAEYVANESAWAGSCLHAEDAPGFGRRARDARCQGCKPRIRRRFHGRRSRRRDQRRDVDRPSIHGEREDLPSRAAQDHHRVRCDPDRHQRGRRRDLAWDHLCGTNTRSSDGADADSHDAGSLVLICSLASSHGAHQRNQFHGRADANSEGRADACTEHDANK